MLISLFEISITTNSWQSLPNWKSTSINDLNSAANNSYLLNVNTQGLTEALITLNNQFGTFAYLSEEALTTFTRLTKEAGLSAESAGMLFRTTVLTGKEVEGTTKVFLGEASALAATNGIALNQKQILNL